MTLTQMKYAITVSDRKSMNEAARELFITQPSLSAAIRELETEIGVQIFRRTNRGITVTPEGEEFLGYARQVVEQVSITQFHRIVNRFFSVLPPTLCVFHTSLRQIPCPFQCAPLIPQEMQISALPGQIPEAALRCIFRKDFHPD